ncbi:MAG TPA: ferric reductase-like transmembrane domain-containing protein [Stellaceae bacterium]|jgi:sulfoxide reductase heme-binding subunit YedZ|nr:ferric reductase-like transmembrane domain-containing protein [Stellaceae bacterium]
MTRSLRRCLKLAVFLAASLPLLVLARAVFWGALAADPYPPAIQETGLWSLRLLLAGLALSPLARAAGWSWPLDLRRMVGLFAAFYALVHLLVWAKDYGFDWPFLASEVAARTYLAVGLAGALLLAPLAATSTDRSVRRLGARVWRRLHWLIYPAAALAYLHFVMAGRFTRAETLIEGILLAALLGMRLARAGRRRAGLRAQYP